MTSYLGVRIAPSSSTANLDNDNNEQLNPKMELVITHFVTLRRVFRSIIKCIVLDIISSRPRNRTDYFKLQHGQTIQKGREPVQRNKVC